MKLIIGVICILPFLMSASTLARPDENRKMLNSLTSTLRCSMELNRLSNGQDGLGELFVEDDIVFFTKEANVKQGVREILLWTISFQGIRAFVFPKSALSKVRFAAKSPSNQGKEVFYYMRYIHAPFLQNRYDEFSVSAPFEGEKYSNYQSLQSIKVNLSGAVYALSEALMKKISAVVAGANQGKILSYQLMETPLHSCEVAAKSKVNPFTQQMSDRVRALRFFAHQEQKKQERNRFPASLPSPRTK